MSPNVSHNPTAVRLAISAEAPAFSAVTYRLSAWANRAILPLPSSTMSNSSHGPIAVRFAISGEAPALSAVTYMPFACARRLITVVAVPGETRPMLAVPRCSAEAAGLPLTDANGSDVVGDEVSSTRYDRPACPGMLNVALVCEPTTVAPVPPSTTVTAWPGHGVRIEMGLLVPETIATVDGVPLLTCTSTLVLCWMETVPSPVQLPGQAGAMRSSPS